MFYDTFCKLCADNGLTPSGAATKIGFNRASVTVWKNTGKAPKQELLLKIANYFGVTADYLLGNVAEPFYHLDNEKIKREINSYELSEEKTPAESGERAISYDDFTYAMQNEAAELTEDDKALLLSMARQLNTARKKKDSE